MQYNNTIPFGIVQSAQITIGPTLVLTFPSFLNSLARSWYLSTFSFSFSSTLASPGTATSIIWQTACCLSTLTRSGLLCSRTSWWSVCMLKSQRILTFSCSKTFPGTCSYHLSATSNPYFLHKHQWTCSFCNAIMSTFIFSLSQRWAFTNYVAYGFFRTLAQPAFLADSPVCQSLCLLPGPLLAILLTPSLIPPSSTTCTFLFLFLFSSCCYCYYHYCERCEPRSHFIIVVVVFVYCLVSIIEIYFSPFLSQLRMFQLDLTTDLHYQLLYHSAARCDQ